MGMLDHWHPMLPSASLRRQPVSVRLAGADIALFRSESGSVGGLDDSCPHRRMRLSSGRVVGERLECHYHGWTFDAAGDGLSPSVPRLHACVPAYDTCEKHGYIWIKSCRSTPDFPMFDVDGWCGMGATEHLAKAPMELVLDNFTEVEHTPMTHELFGYQLERMQEVKTHCTSTDQTVEFTSAGPAKKINMGMRLMLGIGRHDHFHDVWTTRFSPVYSVFDHFWTNPDTGKEAKVRWRAYVFLIPVDSNATRIVTFTYAKSKWPFPPYGGLLPFRGFTRRQVIREIGRDVCLVESLASHDTSIRGMKLSRFDRTLALNRERIAGIYRGDQVEKTENRFLGLNSDL